MTLHRHDDGSASLEGALAAVIILMFLGLIAATSRYANVNAAIDNASFAAARAASIARTPGQARADADAAVQVVLAKETIRCQSRSVDVDTSAFGTPAGTPGTITVRLSCAVEVSDIAYVPAGSKTFTSTAHSSLDSFRERS